MAGQQQFLVHGAVRVVEATGTAGEHVQFAQHQQQQIELSFVVLFVQMHQNEPVDQVLAVLRVGLVPEQAGQTNAKPERGQRGQRGQERTREDKKGQERTREDKRGQERKEQRDVE